ncbi:MAG: hypothetical protein KKB50_21920 [Planctomycetes bacterium]|nr:hypothetical protein [Planctomycetota bacterium]
MRCAGFTRPGRPAYIIMTANDIAKLPPDFTRKGRVDEIFGVYLPTTAERREIFAIHLRRRKREAELFDLEAIAGATGDYSGADIEQVVVAGLKLAFCDGQELTTEYLLQAVPEVRSLSQTDPDRVAAMTEWLDRHTKPASAARRGNKVQAARTNGRKRRVAI